MRRAGAPAGDWTDHAFRLGRWAKQLHPGEGAKTDDWTEQARRLGKTIGRGYRKWRSD